MHSEVVKHSELLESQPPKGRLMALDVLRGLAVILVLGNHLPAPPLDYPSWASNFFLIWKKGGWIGVDLFFVLSGFLVSGLLMVQWKETGKLKLRRFLYRRGLKIYPSFYVMLFSTTLLLVATKREVPIGEFVSELFFMQSYFPNLWNHTWSLAVEEHFYLGLVLLSGLFLLWKGEQQNPFRTLATVGVLVAVVCLLVRCMMSYQIPYSHQAYLMPTHLRIDSLFFGVIIAYLYHFHYERLASFARTLRLPLLLVAGMIAVPAFVWSRGDIWYLHTIGFTLLYLGFGGLLIACITWPRVSVSWRRVGTPVAMIGVHSYSIYLWHLPLLELLSLSIRRFLGTSNYTLVVLLYLVTSVVVGILLYKLIELPVIAWRDRVLPSN